MRTVKSLASDDDEEGVSLLLFAPDEFEGDDAFGAGSSQRGSSNNGMHWYTGSDDVMLVVPFTVVGAVSSRRDKYVWIVTRAAIVFGSDAPTPPFDGVVEFEEPPPVPSNSIAPTVSWV